ncbi:hypothetical protein GCM10007877_01020 [Marinibactrum halimedae]|uniref:Uncharacterized protein n=1 Tax=Marinibactrum halimedae TaxID=1444977 RepID=A0AA37T329_9GAMM|nr:hypothetical protein GCM10007877_01020 [Marinibactrum halimedae]
MNNEAFKVLVKWIWHYFKWMVLIARLLRGVLGANKKYLDVFICILLIQNKDI